MAGWPQNDGQRAAFYLQLAHVRLDGFQPATLRVLAYQPLAAVGLVVQLMDAH